MTRPDSNFGCKLLIVVGLTIACAGIVLHLALPARYERVELIPLVFGVGLALFGAAWLDPNRSQASARVVNEAGGRFVHSVVELRTGTRGTDESPDVTVSVTSEGSAPSAPAAIPPSSGATP
jgi:hypothetical protein